MPSDNKPRKAGKPTRGATHALGTASTVTVGHVVLSCFPGRTHEALREHPRWPPDLFAVTARLVEQSGCYALQIPTNSDDDAVYGRKYSDRVTDLGSKWRTDPTSSEVEQHLATKWSALTDAWDVPLECGDECPHWAAASLELMAIADEASAQIGRMAPDAGNFFAWFYAAGILEQPAEQGGPGLQTACMSVSPQAAVVHPKSRNPRVGCTMRSLSRNLALLPPRSQVCANMMTIPAPRQQASEPLNVLLVPFPYEVSGLCFKRAVASDSNWGLFEIEQRWIDDTPEAARKFAEFLKDLITSAKREVRQVDVVVLPELALPFDLAFRVAELLADVIGLEMFVCGALQSGAPGRPARNVALSFTYWDGHLASWFSQSKHHRWKLDRAQVGTYSLGHAFGPDVSWWEHTHLGRREVNFVQIREGVTVATLICEDLARVDPVQPVLRAVGPNLVLSLLMDGAQLSNRWPGRYASVLSEDPGSSVLTVTSLGMVLRGYDPRERPSRSVALWSEPSGRVQALELDPGNHAILLTLGAVERAERTMDGRRESVTRSVEYGLRGTRQLRAKEIKHRQVLTLT